MFSVRYRGSCRRAQGVYPRNVPATWKAGTGAKSVTPLCAGGESDLTDKQSAALLCELDDIITGDRFPLSPRIGIVWPRPDAFQHPGTFNNNVLTMGAGLVGLTEIYTPERARALNASGDRLRERLNALAQQHDLAMQFTGLGSMLAVHMTDRPIRSEEDAERGNAALRHLFYFDLLAREIWFAKRGMFALSIALDEADSDKLVDTVEEFAQTRAPLFRAPNSGRLVRSVCLPKS